MKSVSRFLCGLTAVLAFRPPSVPLIATSPYISIWSPADNLYDADTVHWSGQHMPLKGLLRVDQKVYCFLGVCPDNVAPIKQENVTVWPLETTYTFVGGGVRLTVNFTAPSILNDLSALSLPLTFISFEATTADGSPHSVAVYFDVSADSISTDTGESVDWADVSAQGYVASRVGVHDQKVVGQSGDGVKINWGYLYLAASRSQGVSSSVSAADDARNAFISNQPLPPPTTTTVPVNANYVMAIETDLGTVGMTRPISNALAPFEVSRTGRIFFAVDEVASMNYFGRILPPFWKKQYPSIGALFDQFVTADVSTNQLLRRVRAYQATLFTNLTNVGGLKFAQVLSLSYRQTTASVTVALTESGAPWIFMKEISSDGDVSTVDVLYPASPMWILLAPEHLRLMMLPLLEYANNATNIPYNLAWAPHHLGVWPICDLSPDQQEQMPMEESGNFLLMLAAIAQLQGQADYLVPYLPILRSWAQYLNSSLPDPMEQLCTDDFEGPSPHNANLAIKGALGLAAYSLLPIVPADEAAVYLESSKNFAAQWEALARDGDHYKLEYDKAGSWSLKYNFLFQKVLGLDVFPDAVIAREINSYRARLNRFGVPLDNRAGFTKIDWLSWVAALAEEDQFQSIFDAIYDFADSCEDRVPLTDWYETESPHMRGFQARSVVGGLYAKMLLAH
eukprot:c11848_g1_i1.p1 GENE.c11848_g1_i1~~c11848_g1_i1.p1  ORF type:complete len:679 (-),score=133.15 c11848_g1_i1:17-2053(-)